MSSVSDSLTNSDILVKKCVEKLWDRDIASKHLNMEIVSVEQGYSSISMTVTENMVQGHGTCHGGYLFILADSAFAFASNTYGKVTVASGCNIEYVRPAMLGDNLIAVAEEVSRGKRTGIYDIRITNQENKVIALFRGKSYQLDASIL